jgi:hypothetical protein
MSSVIFGRARNFYIRSRAIKAWKGSSLTLLFMGMTETLTMEAAEQLIIQDGLQEGVGETEVLPSNGDGLWGFRGAIGQEGV